MIEPIFMRVGEGEINVELPDFIGAMSDFLGLLREYDSSVSERRTGNLIWRVTTLQKAPSPVVGVTPFPKKKLKGLYDASDQIERELINNVSSLTETGERPKLLSDASMKRVERIARMSSKIGSSAIYTTVKSVPLSTSVNSKTLKHVEELTSVKSSSFGTINGTLGSISVHKGLEFRVWDEQTGRPVRCFFGSSQEGKVKDLLGKKITVTGMIKADKFGRAISLKVDDFDIARSLVDLPTIEEMRGLIPNFTGGLSLREYFEETD